MTEKLATYQIATQQPPAIDPEALRICQLCFHRAISAQEGGARATALMCQRRMEELAGWVAVESGNGYEVLMQEDEL